MKLELLITLLFVSTSLSANELLGAFIPPYPPGYTSKQGSCIGGELGSKEVDICNFSISIIEDEMKNPLYVAFKKNNEWKGTQLGSVILDVLPYPKLSKNQAFLTFECYLNGKRDLAIMAIIEHTESGEKEVKTAYRVNLDSRKIEEIKTNGVHCESSEWGV